MIWEYLITLANEVDIFWRRPKTATSLLFIFTRWAMVASALTQFLPITEATFDSMPYCTCPTLIAFSIAVKPSIGLQRCSSLLNV